MESAWTMKVPLDREGKDFAIFELKDIDYDVYMATQSFIKKDKMREAVEMFIEQHRIGGDEVSKIKGNFVAFLSAQDMVVKMLDPVPGELKKNLKNVPSKS